MNVRKQIREMREKMRVMEGQIRWLSKHRHKLAKIDNSGCRVSFFQDGQLDLDRLAHPQVISAVRSLGGQWKKRPSHDATRIDYESVVDGVTVRCWAGEPPPACRIVEVDEYVPAQVIPASVRKVKKMICPGVGPGADPLVMSAVREQTK